MLVYRLKSFHFNCVCHALDANSIISTFLKLFIILIINAWYINLKWKENDNWIKHWNQLNVGKKQNKSMYKWTEKNYKICTRKYSSNKDLMHGSYISRNLNHEFVVVSIKVSHPLSTYIASVPPMWIFVETMHWLTLGIWNNLISLTFSNLNFQKFWHFYRALVHNDQFIKFGILAC